MQALPTNESLSSSEGLGTALFRIAFVLAIGFFGFVAGSYAMFAEAPPARYLADAYRGGQALLAKNTQYDSPYPPGFWQKARTEQRGVVTYDPARATNGYTLYTSGEGQRAVLVSMTGEVLHEWNLPFSAIWDETASVQKPRPDEMIHYNKAYLYPNGDLLAIYEALGDTPWGYGLAKMDKDSRLVWKYLAHAHHDLDVGPDGNIYLLTQEISHTIVDRWRHLQPPRIDDFVVVLSPDGQELKKVSMLDALVNSPYARLLNTVAWYSKDDYYPRQRHRAGGRGGRDAPVGPVRPPGAGLDARARRDRAARPGQGGLHLGGARALDRPARSRSAAERQHAAVRQCRRLRRSRRLAGDRVRPEDLRDRVELRGQRGPPLPEHPAFGSAAACQRQHADHRIRTAVACSRSPRTATSCGNTSIPYAAAMGTSSSRSWPGGSASIPDDWLPSFSRFPTS